MTATISSEKQHQNWKCTQICAAFEVSLWFSFLIIVIMLRDSRFIILISDTNLQGQLLLF